MLLAIVMIAGSACNPIASRLPNSSTPIIQAQTAIPEHLPTATIEIQPTNLPTLTPLVMIPILTWTPLPTLSPNEASARMDEWLQGSPECLLPCWGGITPGETDWQNAKQILASVVSIRVIEEQTLCSFGPCNNMEWRSREDTRYGTSIQSFLASGSEDLIIGMTIGVSKPSSTYRLDTVLAQYGPPEHIYLTPSNLFAPPEELFLEFILAYPNHRVIILYQWKARLIGDNLVSCIQDGSAVKLYINPQISGVWDENAIKHILYGQYKDYEIDGIPFKPLEEVTEMTIENFYKEFKIIDGSECIITSSRYWLP
jgi:hypothetical protein